MIGSQVAQVQPLTGVTWKKSTQLYPFSILFITSNFSIQYLLHYLKYLEMQKIGEKDYCVEITSFIYLFTFHIHERWKIKFKLYEMCFIKHG